MSLSVVLAAVSVNSLGLSLRGVLGRPVSAAGTGPAPAEAPASSSRHPVPALGPAVPPGPPGGWGPPVPLHAVPGGGGVAPVSRRS